MQQIRRHLLQVRKIFNIFNLTPGFVTPQLLRRYYRILAQNFQQQQILRCLTLSSKYSLGAQRTWNGVKIRHLRPDRVTGLTVKLKTEHFGKFFGEIDNLLEHINKAWRKVAVVK